MQIQDFMKKNVYAIPATATVRDAIRLLVSHHIGLLPVWDDEKRPLGVVGLRDLAMPTTIHLLIDVDFIGSSANIVVAVLSKKKHRPITSGLWIKRGLPVMLLTCLIASLIFFLAYA